MARWDEADDDWFPPGLAAKKLGVSPETIIRWANNGHLRGVVRTAGGHRRIPASEIDRLLHEGHAAQRAAQAGAT